MRKQGVVTGRKAEVRLGPAEARAIIRHKLTAVAARHGLEAGDVYDLVRRMEVRSYSAGQVLVPAGVRAECLGLLLRGYVAVQFPDNTLSRPVQVLLPGSTFGEMMIEGEPSGATLQALTRCDVWYLRRAQLQSIASEREKARQIASLQRAIGRAGAALVIVLVLLVALSLPSSRRTLALVPLAVGQWCDEGSWSVCTENAWQLAATLTPDDPGALLALGTYYHRQGDVAAAELAFEAAGALAPDMPEVHNNLGLIYAGQRDHERAIGAFEEALNLEPGIAASEHNLAVSMQALGRHREALDHYRAEIALGEPTASTYVNMSIAYYEIGDMEGAADAARQALETDEGLAPAYAVLGAVAIAADQPEQALSSLEQAVTLDREYGEAHFFLGLTYRALDRPQDAVIAFEEALAHAGNELTRVRIRRHLNELYELEEQGHTY